MSMIFGDPFDLISELDNSADRSIEEDQEMRSVVSAASDDASSVGVDTGEGIKATLEVEADQDEESLDNCVRVAVRQTGNLVLLLKVSIFFLRTRHFLSIELEM